jgi:very-short-patch-repair endonuclease
MGRIANYVIELLAEALGEKPETEKRFPWALGDASPTTGRRVRLPFDAVWMSRRLIVEVDEDQHVTQVAFWDKPNTSTVSGVDRGTQRRMYDERKRAAARAHGYTVVEIPWERRPEPSKRDRVADLRAVTEMLSNARVQLSP